MRGLGQGRSAGNRILDRYGGLNGDLFPFVAYLPLSFIVSRADIARSAGMPRDLSTLIAMVSLGNFARRYRSKNSFSG
jgi:hypothetical protein